MEQAVEFFIKCFQYIFLLVLRHVVEHGRAAKSLYVVCFFNLCFHSMHGSNLLIVVGKVQQQQFSSIVKAHNTSPLSGPTKVHNITLLP